MSLRRKIVGNSFALLIGLLLCIAGISEANTANITFGLIVVAFEAVYLYELISGRILLGCEKLNETIRSYHS